jgi:predicted AlkP superfamily pyrophosphatase or phosphodiesterase
MKGVVSIVFCLILSFALKAQTKQNTQANRPKLVVGMVVDQMRWDYLYRYQNRYGTNGFNRILKEGFSCENAFIPYTPTYTAAGHTCVYTGSVPSLNGIMGNSWYSKVLKRNVYCTEDDSVQTVGSTSVAGKQSPKNLWSNTITDELRMATNFQNKTIAIALKDRGAILPGGHTANGAYWFDNANGQFITSTFYMNELPKWVNDFNAKKYPDTYLKQGWQTLYPINTYTQSTADATPYENPIPGEGITFPHQTDTIKRNKYESFRHTPFGNTYTMQMAKAAVEGEQLGQRGVTDFLAFSLSSTDYIGHAFGPNSIEVEDTYLRLDKELADFLNYLDAKVGKGNYLFFITADHGAAHNPAFVRDHRMPGGVLDDADIRKALNSAIDRAFGSSQTIAQVINYQIYFNDEVLASSKINKTELKQFIIRELLKYPGIAKAFDIENLGHTILPGPLKEMVINGYNQKLSGDIQFVFQPQWYDSWSLKGTTHGVWAPYDSHIPLLWYGWNVKAGKLNRKVYMTDIAPTIAALLNIQMPNANIGEVIPEVRK